MSHFFSNKAFFALLLLASRALTADCPAMPKPMPQPTAQPTPPMPKPMPSMSSMPAPMGQPTPPAPCPTVINAPSDILKPEEVDTIAANPNVPFVFITPEAAACLCNLPQMPGMPVPAPVCELVSYLKAGYQTAPCDTVSAAVAYGISCCPDNSPMRTTLNDYKEEIDKGNALVTVEDVESKTSNQDETDVTRRHGCCNRIRRKVICSLIVKNCLKTRCLVVTDNAAIGGNLAVGGNETVAGSLTVGGIGDFSATGINIGRFILGPNGIVPVSPTFTTVGFPGDIIVLGNIAFLARTGTALNAVGNTAEGGLNLIRGSIQLPGGFLAAPSTLSVVAGAGFTIAPVAGDPNAVLVTFDRPYSGLPTVTTAAQDQPLLPILPGVTLGGFVEVEEVSPTSIILRNLVPGVVSPLLGFGNIIHFIAVGPIA